MNGSLGQSGLEIVGPTRVRVNDTAVSVGRGGVVLLAALNRGRVSVAAVKRRLWRDSTAPSGRLRQAARRVNVKLAAAGWQWRIRFDTGDVLIMPEPAKQSA